VRLAENPTAVHNFEDLRKIMNKPHVIKVSCAAAYKDGSLLFDDAELIADTLLKPPTIESEGLYGIIELRLAVPSVKTEAMLNGLRSGLVSLYIEGMKSEVDQAAEQ
jgi:hypothetical protein